MKFLDQEASADQENPEWESDKDPRKIGTAELKKQREHKAEVCDPTRRNIGIDDDGRCRHQEHARHLDHVNVDDIVDHRASEMERHGAHSIF